MPQDEKGSLGTWYPPHTVDEHLKQVFKIVQPKDYFVSFCNYLIESTTFINFKLQMKLFSIKL